MEWLEWNPAALPNLISLCPGSVPCERTIWAPKVSSSSPTVPVLVPGTYTGNLMNQLLVSKQTSLASPISWILHWTYFAFRVSCTLMSSGRNLSPSVGWMVSPLPRKCGAGLYVSPLPYIFLAFHACISSIIWTIMQSIIEHTSSLTCRLVLFYHISFCVLKLQKHFSKQSHLRSRETLWLHFQCGISFLLSLYFHKWDLWKDDLTLGAFLLVQCKKKKKVPL